MPPSFCTAPPPLWVCPSPRPQVDCGPLGSFRSTGNSTASFGPNHQKVSQPQSWLLKWPQTRGPWDSREGQASTPGSVLTPPS